MKNIQQQVIDGKVNPYELLEFWNEKELSRNDIQSFKFKTQDGKEHIHETDDLLFFVIWNDKDEFGITYNKKEHYIKTIKHFSGLHNMNECWMPINIKNKSELKILLEQLNIY